MSVTEREARLILSAQDKITAPMKAITTKNLKHIEALKSKMKAVNEARGSLRAIDDFENLRKKIKASGDSMSNAREAHRKMIERFQATPEITNKMRKEFERTRKSVNRLTEAHKKNRQGLLERNEVLKLAGVDTKNLAKEQERLTRRLKEAERAGKVLQDIQLQRDRIIQRTQKAREQMDASLARASGMTFTGHASLRVGREMHRAVMGPIGLAREFESRMANVRKVMSTSDAEFEAFTKSIRDLSKEIAVDGGAEALAAIAAEGSKMGIANDELLEFVRLISQMSVALEISPEAAADNFAKVRNGLKLSAEEAERLINQLNAIDNAEAAKAEQLLEFMRRVGVDGNIAGLVPEQTLAFGAAMVASGEEVEVAATSLRNLMINLQSGEWATERQLRSLSALGLEAKSVAEAFSKDGMGVTLDVMERISRLPEHKQQGILTGIFGKEARGIAKIFGDPQSVRDILAITQDSSLVDGGIQKEFGERETTAVYQEMLLGQKADDAMRGAGLMVLDDYKQLLDTMSQIVEKVAAWTEENPELAESLLKAGAAVSAIAVAGGAVMLTLGGLLGTFAVVRFGFKGVVGSLELAALAFKTQGALMGAQMEKAAARTEAANVRMRRSFIKSRAALLGTGLLAGGALVLASQSDYFAGDGSKGQSFGDGLGKALKDAQADAAKVAGRVGLLGVPDGGSLGEMIKSYINPLGFGQHQWSHEELAGFDEYYMEHRRKLALGEGQELGFSHLSDEMRAAALTVQKYRFGGALPTQRNAAQSGPVRQRLEQEVARLESMVATLTKASAPEAVIGAAEADLATKKRELEHITKELESSGERAKELTEALRVLGVTEVPLNLDMSDLDNALAKVGRLKASIAVPGAGGKLQERAKGGPFGRDPLLVGENGPELYFPNRAGFIVSNNKFRKMSEQLNATKRGMLISIDPELTANLARINDTPESGPSVTIGTVNLNVNVPSGVTNPAEIAQAAKDIFDQEVGQMLSARLND